MEIQLTPKHRIGGHEPVFIIAEVGSNWKSFADCLHSIAMAKAVGADAVKFQLYDRDSLYGQGNLTAYHPNGELIGPFKLDGQLDISWIPALKTHADAIGIEFICSAFSPELVDAVNPYVNCHKVASAELSHVRILQKLKQIGKPVILSTGASGNADIDHSLRILGDVPVALLYCIAAYPARSIRLEHIDRLRSDFHRLVGFSDHSTDIFTHPAEAIFQHKACIIEKHFNAIDGLVGPDSKHSLTVDEFKLMVTRCRNNLAIEARQSHEEKEMYTKHNRRLIATTDIHAGDVLRENGNFGIYRSLKEDTRAFSPYMLYDDRGQDHINGKTAKREIKAGDGIGIGDV